MQRVGNVLDGRTPSGELLLDRNADSLGEVLVAIFSLQLFLELRGKHSQKLSIAGDERPFLVGGPEHDRVARSADDDGTTKMALNGFYVRPRLYEFHAQRRQARACALAS